MTGGSPDGGDGEVGFGGGLEDTPAEELADEEREEVEEEVELDIAAAAVAAAPPEV